MSCTHGDASCWFCLEGGEDFPLRRQGCACREDAGWAHIHCLSSFARDQTSKLTLDQFGKLLKLGEGTNWQRCHICKLDFVADVARDLADEWMNAVSQLEDGEPEKLMAQVNYVSGIGLSQSAADKKQAVRLCEEIRACAKRNRHRYDDSPSFVICFDCKCLVILSTTYESLGNSEKAKEYTKELKKLNKETPFGNNEILSLLMDPSKRGSEELRNIHIDMYNQSVKTEGGDSPATIRWAMWVGHSYVEAFQYKEAIKWLDDSYPRAKRVFGKDHPHTLNVRFERLVVRETIGPPRVAKLATKDSAATRKVTLLRATKDGTKYIATIESTDGKSPKKVKVSSNQIILEEDTLIVHPGGFKCFVDSYNKETNTYKALAFSEIDGNSEHVYLDVPRSVKVCFVPMSFDMRSFQANYGAL